LTAAIPEADIEHGTVSTYVCRRCRCRPCRDAKSEYDLDRRIEAQRTNFAGRVHGTATTYGLGCRCRLCSAGNSERRRARKARR
jgi:hypothetical protein